MSIKIDTSLFLDDFDAESRVHIEKIEKAFLDTATLADDPTLISDVFRAAHSLKGTAGFFSFKKIVALAHELESVFSQIKEGKLTVDDEIADIALQSVDCLKDLVDHVQADDMIEIDGLVNALKNYLKKEVDAADDDAGEINIPFDYNCPDTNKMLKKAFRHGHKIYYVSIGFNRSLGKYYKNPKGMIDSILSIGTIVEVIVNGNFGKIIRQEDTTVLADEIISALSEYDTTTLELLVTSVLAFDLFSIAIEVDKRYIRLVPKKNIFGDEESAEKPEAAKAVSVQKDQQKTVLHKTEAEHEQIYTQALARKNNFSIRLDISVINGLMDLANEMILTRNQLLSAVSGYERSIVGLKPVLHDMNRLSSEIQEKVMLTRMQPISVIFDKFPRIIRDTAKMINKDIEVEIFGGEVTLDKYLLDSLADPITQIVKNSADHGLESAERRAELGKPKKGKITLNAYMHDGFALIEVTDDGAGINTEALKLKSIERGIVTQEELETMPKSDILALILAPGISTAKQVTSLSGRGVGMDIVKTNIEKLNGSIEIDSEINKGTTIRLKMPLTLSVIRTLIVTIDSVQYAVPEMNVERIVRIWRAMPSRRIERLNNSLVLILNGRIIPVVTMDELDAKATRRALPSIETLLERINGRAVNKCLVLKAGGKSFAFLIDDAVETEQTLVKPLPKYLKKCLCYSSVTVLGNGNAIAVLDAEGILRLMGIEATPQSIVDEEIEKEKKEEKQILIFKCSGMEYFAIEINEIFRIEVVDPEHIQEIGNGQFINIAGKTIRVVRPENYAPVKKRRYTAEKLYLLTLKKSVSPIGLLVAKVLDKVAGNFEFDDKQLYSDFIFGTSRFNEKILIFLNPAAIVEDVEKDKQANKVKKEGGVA
ncbi:MAG: chemotaxis protein CheA [Spirochaetaceae bacterium]|nr:chemotaxis protein CheA [Spirochaetaceae bacterium]